MRERTESTCAVPLAWDAGSAHGRLLMHIYAGFSLPFLYAWLLALNFFIWDTIRLNYKFIFEWNPRDYIALPQYTAVRRRAAPPACMQPARAR